MNQALFMEEFLKSLPSQSPGRIEEQGFPSQYFYGAADIDPTPARLKTRDGAIEFPLCHDMRNT
jgi:hypothetical protein